MKILVKFLCCKDSHIFIRYRECYTCKCGQSMYDSGDGHYDRVMGKIELTYLDKNDEV